MPDTSDSKFTASLDGIPLLNIAEDGTPPPSRLRRASDLRNIFMRMRDDDDTNSRNRAMMQELLDGDPPYDESELREAGQQGVTNLNFGGAEQQLERAKAPFYSLVQDPEVLVNVHTLYGAEDERADLDATLSEEISRTIRNSAQFPYQTDRLIHKFVWDGVGVMAWPDDIDWRFRSHGLGQFWFPRQAAACEDELEVAVSMEEYTVTRLYAAIRNPEKAAANGWDVAAVRNAIRKATSAEPIYNDWERLEDEIKNNDISVANNTPVIRVIVGWWKEFDGTVAHGMTTETPCGETEGFLYCGRRKYRSMREAFVLFPYGMGTNTKIHGIRGLGYKIFAFEQQRNRSLCRLIDQSNLASCLMLQPDGEESLANVGLQYFGNTAVIDPNCKVVQYAMPDLQRSVMPALSEMERLRNDRVGSYSTDNVFDGDQRKTKFEVSAQLQQSAALSGTSLDFFYAPFERGMQQTVRRMIRRTYVPQDPGGPEIADLHLRLTRRGVPLEALYRIDVSSVRVVRAIGAGSASARTLALARMSDLRPRMDDVGQFKLDRALSIDAIGVAQTNDYFPADGVKRTTVDTNIAILENQMMLSGAEIPVLPSDRHLAHAREHIKPLLDGFTAVEQGQLPIEEMAVSHRVLYQHAAEHVDSIAGDPESTDEAAMLRQMMQQIGEVISNGLRKAQSAANEGGGEDGRPQGGGPSDKDIAAFEERKAKMEFAREMHELKKAQLLDMSATKRAIADAEAAARIARTAAQPQPKKTAK